MKPLFHYTSMDGLLGIVGRSTLWATNIEYLNDASEYRHGAELIREVLNQLKQSASGHLQEFVTAAIQPPEFFGATDIFLTSLTEEGDLLTG